MSGLAAVLAGRLQPGVHEWHAAFPVEDVRHAVEHAGWRFAHVDGWTHQDKEAFLDAVAEALAFPDWFGHNFDALADCLSDVAGPEGAGTVLLWDGWGTLAREDRRAFDVALDVLRERTEESQRAAFTVLLRGEGPRVDVPSLDREGTRRES